MIPYKLHYLCCISTSTFILPVIYYYNTCMNFYCYTIIMPLIVLCIICSLLFWTNPIKKNIYHKIDGIIAKITYSSVVFYTIIKLINIQTKKYLYEYLIFNIFVILLFLFSNYYSSKKWCCPQHIFFHTMFHIVGMISTIYTYF
jgi:hypothetical protein